MVEFLNEKLIGNEACAVVYTSTRKKSEFLQNELNKRQLGTRAYHAGMSVRAFFHNDKNPNVFKLQDTDRSSVHQQWMRGDVKVITATIAFGKG